MKPKKHKTDSDWSAYRFESSLRTGIKELNKLELYPDSTEYRMAFALHSLMFALLELPGIIEKGKK